MDDSSLLPDERELMMTAVAAGFRAAIVAYPQPVDLDTVVVQARDLVTTTLKVRPETTTTPEWYQSIFVFSYVMGYRCSVQQLFPQIERLSEGLRAQTLRYLQGLSIAGITELLQRYGQPAAQQNISML